jgi:transporter family protein
MSLTGHVQDPGTPGSRGSMRFGTPKRGESMVLSFERRSMINAEDHSRSVGGRLGGHFESIRSVKFEDEDAEAGESTLLLTPEEKLLLEEQLAPPLVVWVPTALACACAFAFYNIFIKKGSFTVTPMLGAVVLQVVAALLGCCLLGAVILQSGSAEDIYYDRNGIKWSVWAGISVGIAEMLSFFVSGMGVQATQFIPIIIGGSVAFGSLLGLLMLGEKMMLHGWFGVGMLVTGIAMVATDPGDKVSEGGETDGDGAPPLYIWIWPALLCAMAYAMYNINIKRGSASINPLLGGVVLQLVAAILGSLLLLVLIIKDRGTSSLHFDAMGLFWAMCAGLSVGTAEILSFCVSGMGVQATQSIPIIIGGSVGFGAVIGVSPILGESLLYQGWSGVVLLIAGIGFVATDPGEKVAGH